MISTDSNWAIQNANLARAPLWILVIDGVGYFWGNFSMAQIQVSSTGYGVQYASGYGTY